MRINIMARWQEFNSDSCRSMKEDFAAAPSAYKEQILKYLQNGTVVVAATSGDYDVFSGERITATKCILTDGEYSWNSSLEYYVRRYNLRIPKELEEKILKSGGTLE